MSRPTSLSAPGSRRLGVMNNRPSLESMRTTRPPPSTKASAPAETDDDNDDDDNMGYDSYYYDSEQEEEEALLSKRYGEAMEDNTHDKKRKSSGNTDQDIAQEYKAKELEQKRKKRITQRMLQPEDLLSSKGLTVVRHGIATKFQNNHGIGNKPKYNKSISSMAKFSRQLIDSYETWMDTMSDGIPLEEGMWKLYKFQSKTNIKHRLTDMRNEVRNEHVEKTLGLEKAESILQQLQDYHDTYNDKQDHEDADDDFDYNINDNPRTIMDSEQEPTTNNNDNLEEPTTTTIGENEGRTFEVNNNDPVKAGSSDTSSPMYVDNGTTTGDLTSPLVESSGNEGLGTSEKAAIVDQADDTPPPDKSQSCNKTKHVLDDSSDEEETEALFDDVKAGKKASDAAVVATITSKKANRLVLEDDDDDDDDDNILNEDTNMDPAGNDDAVSSNEKAINAVVVSECQKGDGAMDNEVVGVEDATKASADSPEPIDDQKQVALEEEKEENIIEDKKTDTRILENLSNSIMEGEIPDALEEHHANQDTEITELDLHVGHIGQDTDGLKIKNVDPLYSQESEVPTVIPTQFSQAFTFTAPGSPDDLDNPLNDHVDASPSLDFNTQESETPTVIATQTQTNNNMTQDFTQRTSAHDNENMGC